MGSLCFTPHLLNDSGLTQDTAGVKATELRPYFPLFLLKLSENVLQETVQSQSLKPGKHGQSSTRTLTSLVVMVIEHA